MNPAVAIARLASQNCERDPEGDLPEEIDSLSTLVGCVIGLLGSVATKHGINDPREFTCPHMRRLAELMHEGLEEEGDASGR